MLRCADLAAEAALPPRAPVPALPVAATAGAEPLVVPNADGIIDLAAVPVRAETADRITNPFRVRWQPPRPVREPRAGR